MKNILIVALCFLILPLFSQEVKDFKTDFNKEKTPWTHLDFANDPADFQFAIVTDRTGSPRPSIFEDAVKKLNWLMPEFVMSVGDLIRGKAGKDSATLDKQWAGHFDRIAPLKMPFFHLAGNHDIKANNDWQVEYWNKMFGSPFYSFTYKNVLFLGLFTNEGTQTLSEEQVDYFKKVLEENKEVRWTMVFMHHPLWRYDHDSNFDDLEAILQDRDYTVFAGHQHTYLHSTEHENKDYYVLATTGGGSPLLGNSFGSFDHITWVTMTDEGPSMANLRLDGILSHDVANAKTAKLSRALIDAVFYESYVLVDDEKNISKGTAYLKYINKSDHPLYLKGRFYHNHTMIPLEDKMSMTIPARSEKMVTVDLLALEPFNINKKVQLEFDGTIGYEMEEYPDLFLGGKSVIKVEKADFKILPNEEVEFIDQYTVAMNAQVPGTNIYYTTDGSTPDQNSSKYNSSLTITKATTIKAVLINEEGMKSTVDKMKLKPVKPGKGAIVKIYDYAARKDLGFNLKEIRKKQAESIRFTKTLDPMKTSGKEKFFGLSYHAKASFDETGTYHFSAVSDDAIALYIDGKEVLADRIKHKARSVSGTIELTKGMHEVEIHYFQHRKEYVLDIQFETPSGKKQALTIDMLQVDKMPSKTSLKMPANE
ncbi:MAG: FN3 associated domain-containing protein [Bacteroidota bacterium]